MKILKPKAEVKAILSILEGPDNVKLELLNALTEEHFGYRPMHGAFTVIMKMLHQSAMDLPTMETFLQHHELEQESVDDLTTPTSSPIRKKDDALRLCDILEYYRQIRSIHSFLREQTTVMRDQRKVAVDDLIADMEATLLNVRSDVHAEKMYHTGKGAEDTADEFVEEAFSSEMPRLVPSTFGNFDRRTGGFGATNLIILASHMKGGKCVGGGTLVETELGLVPIESLFDGTEKDDEFVPLNIKIVDRYGTSTATHRLAKWHNGAMSLTSHCKYKLTASRVHPVLVLDSETKSLRYKRMEELVVDDYIVIDRKYHLFPQKAPTFNWSYPEFEQVKLVCQICGGTDTGLPAHLSKVHPGADRDEYRKKHLPELQKWPKVHDNVTNTSYVLPKTMSLDLATVLGYLVAEGQQMPSWSSFSQSDPVVLEDFCTKFRRAFPDAPLSVEPEGENTLNKKAFIRSKYIANFFQYLGLEAVHSREKEVPWVIFRSPKECVRSFLRAYFEGDGGGEKERLITCTSASEKLIDQIQQLLLRFGIISLKREKRNRATNGARIYRIYYRLVISRDSVTNFLEEIGFVTERKMQSVKDIERRSDPIPFITEAAAQVREAHMTTKNGWYNIPDGTKRRLVLHTQPNVALSKKAILKNPALLDGLSFFYPELVKAAGEALEHDFYFDKITKIEEIEGPVKLYDLNVPGSHSYVANGMVVHNSIMALNMGVEQYLRHNLDVIYIPLEMDKAETAQRLLSKISTVEHTKIRTKTWNAMEKKQARKAWRRFKSHGVKNDCRFTIWPLASLTIPQLKMQVRPMGYTVIIIDYLNLLIDPTNTKDEWLRLGNFARDLKLVTKELDALIIAPTQMNMDGQIRYSKAIGEHANAVWTWVYGEEEIGTHVISIRQPFVRGWAPFKFQLREDFERMSITDHLGGDFDDEDFATITKNETMRGV